MRQTDKKKIIVSIRMTKAMETFIQRESKKSYLSPADYVRQLVLNEMISKTKRD